jgi:hypothetical protein
MSELVAEDATYTEWEGHRLILSPGFETESGIAGSADASPRGQESSGKASESGALGRSSELVGAGASRAAGNDAESADRDSDARGPEWTDS